jgi:hypothetical protein
MDKFRVGTWLVLTEYRFELGRSTLPCLIAFVQAPAQQRSADAIITPDSLLAEAQGHRDTAETSSRDPPLSAPHPEFSEATGWWPARVTAYLPAQPSRRRSAYPLTSAAGCQRSTTSRSVLGGPFREGKDVRDGAWQPQARPRQARCINPVETSGVKSI